MRKSELPKKKVSAFFMDAFLEYVSDVAVPKYI